MGIQNIVVITLLVYHGLCAAENFQGNSVVSVLGKGVITFHGGALTGQQLPEHMKLYITSGIYNDTISLFRQKVSFPVVYRNKLSYSPYITNESSACHYTSYLGAFSFCHGIKGFLRFPKSSVHIIFLNPSLSNILNNGIVPMDVQTINITRFQFSVDEESKFKKLRRKRRSIRFSSSTPHVVKLYFITDNELRKLSGPRKLTDRVINIMNVVNAAYQVFNVTFAIVGLEIWGSNMISIDKNNPESILQSLENYKRENILIRRADCVHMLIGRIQYATKGEAVGRARIGSMCSQDRCVGFSLDSILKSDFETALVVAHELGHNFGMSHDKHDTDCQTCIMSPSMEYTRLKMTWSQRSQETMRDIMEQGLGRCLNNAPKGLDPKVRTCGNGIVEEGEECDCGTTQSLSCVQNKCCDMHTCRLAPGAQCATGACCEKSTCKFKARSHTCRPTEGPCDLPEYCSGEDEYCPANFYKENGVSCYNSGHAYCFNRDCQTRQSWCQALWGPTGRVGANMCFNKNLQYHHFGHCLRKSGTRLNFQRRATEDVIPCRPENIMCGRLWCDHSNEKSMFYGVIAQYSYELSRVSYCDSLIADIGYSQRDPGLVPNGASCGENKVCFNSTCLPIEKVRQFKDCNCHGHGVCNNAGHCHCDAGYMPPDCQKPGNGGSLDSGPPPDKWAVRPIIIVLIFIVLLFMCFVIFLIILCMKNRRTLAEIKFRYRSVPSDKRSKSIEGTVEYKNKNGSIPTATKTKVRNKTKTTSNAESQVTRGPPPKPPPKPSSLTLNIPSENHTMPSPDTPPLPPYPNEYAIPNGQLSEDAEKPKKRPQISSPIFQTSTNPELQHLPILNRSGRPAQKAATVSYSHHTTPPKPPPPPPPPSYTKPTLPPLHRYPPGHRPS